MVQWGERKVGKQSEENGLTNTAENVGPELVLIGERQRRWKK